MSFAYLLAFVALTSLAGPAFGQFNKCTGKDGKVVYTDGRCPPGAKGDPKFSADAPMPVPELSWDRQIFARMCVDRWDNEASPQARARAASALVRQAAEGGQRVKENLRQAGLTLDQAVKQQIETDFVQPFHSDCLHFGFRRIDASTDWYNERMSRALEKALDERYPDSKESYERARR